MEENTVLGIDYGTQSVRAVVCRAADGAVLSQSECAYAHRVMSEALPDGTPLPAGWALQHPQDYLDALFACVPDALRASGVQAGSIRGLALDFTGSTPLPLDRDGMPLCFHPEFAGHPHAYVKLWKHHGAARQAEALNRLIGEKAPNLLAHYGGRVSSEVFFAKLLETAEEDPALFAQMDQYMEAGDWVVQRLTGAEVRSLSMAVNKAFYQADTGYSPFLEDAFPALGPLADGLLRGRMIPIGQVAGYLQPDMARRLGLPAGIPVAPSMLDGHAAVPAVGITGAGSAIYNAGTSSSLLLVEPAFHAVEGICSCNFSGTLPGLYGYASGQSAMGDQLAWYVQNGVPEALCREAEARGVSVHQLLSEQAAALAPGQSGLLALDWWNGNRSILADTRLTGLMLGMTLQTKPHEIYRALMESLAFGLRRILEAHAEAGIHLNCLRLAGGISYKNPLFMQIISDVTRLPLLGSKPVPAPAIGSAIYAAVVSGCHPSLSEAIDRMNCLSGQNYIPDPARSAVYDRLYAEYKRLYDHFGRGENDVMKRLLSLAAESRQA